MSINELQSQNKIHTSKYDNLYQKYSKNLVDEVSKRDPTKNTYLEWMLEQISSGANIDEVEDLIKFYNRFKAKFKDINEYNFETLSNDINDYKDNEERMRSGGVILYEDDDFILVRPDDRNACISYGRGTNWCVSSSETDKMYKHYSTANDLFYFVINKHRDQKLAFRFNRKDGDIKLAEIENPNQEPHNLSESAAKEYLGNNYNKFYAIMLADSPKAPDTEDYRNKKEMLDNIENDLLLGKEVHYDAKIMFMENRDLSPEVQMILANDEGLGVRKIFAYKENLLPEVQMLLANDEDLGVRRSFAYNRNLLPEIQMLFANDPEVKKDLAYNENLIPEVQMLLANDRDPKVRRYFAYNENLLPEVQMLLANDKEPEVRKYFAYNENLLPEVQMLLANDKDPEVRRAFAYSNENLLPEVQMLLANDKDPEVRKNFAHYNRNLLPEVQMILANDRDPEVRNSLTHNSNLTPEVEAIIDSKRI
jgi:phage anti-repressor protein